MVDNALRCIEEDYPALLGLAEAMGVITLDGSTVIPAEGTVWDYIGYKIKEDGTTLMNAQRVRNTSTLTCVLLFLLDKLLPKPLL
jgi:hypothetical protein